MTIELAPADPAAVITHRQTHGHAAVRGVLGALFPNIRDFSFCNADREAFTCSVLRLADLTVLRTAMSAYQCRVEPSDLVRLSLPTHGVLAVTLKGRESVAIPGVAGVACAHEVSSRIAPTEHAGFVVKFARDRLLAQARTLAGEQFTADDIEASIDLRAPAGASLFRTVGTLFSEVEHLSTIRLGNLVCASANELVMNLAAAAVLPRLRERVARPQKWVGASAVEAARQFIHAHAAEPVRLGSLADRLGVSLRALQVGFRRRFGCTLSQYLFERRLDLARTRLLAATDEMTVTTVALECGFVNAGAFADRYRRAFGELPSQTLRKCHPRIDTAQT